MTLLYNNRKLRSLLYKNAPRDAHSRGAEICRQGDRARRESSASGTLFYSSAVCSLLRFSRTRARRNRIGNTIAAASPLCSEPLSFPETKPTREGPVVQPRSPARANKANMAVPPFGHAAAARLKVPGHMMPTERPHSAQPSSPRTGTGAKTASR